MAAVSSGVGLCPGDAAAETGHVMQAALGADPSAVKRVPFLPIYASFLRDLIKRGVGSKDSYHFPLLG